MRRIIANVLSRLGHTDVVAVSNGREALKRLETEPFDVVITDWYMPEVSGIEFLRTIRSNPVTKDLPIIVVSGNGSKDDVAQAIQLRVSGYVLKPFTAETLKERIAAICSTLRSTRDSAISDSAISDGAMADSATAERATPELAAAH
jgi:two-component system chemotaxis response regulator CheY